MKFKVDENLPVEVTQRLQAEGYDALSVLDQRMGGEADANLAEICQQEKRAIITLDLDFADIRTYPPQSHSGLIVLRLNRQDKPHILHVIERLIKALKEEEVKQSLWIVDERRIRIRS